MKNLLLALILLFSCVAQAQIFNRSKVGSLDALPFQLGNKLYIISSTSIDEIDASGEVSQSTALPFLSDYRASKSVLRKANGNLLIIGNSQASCDLLADLGYFAYEYSTQMVLVDSTHQALYDVGNVLQLLELSQNRYFVLNQSGYLLLDDNLDTIATAITPNLAQINRAIYLGGDEVLIYSQTWASSTPMYNILNLNTGTINPWTNARAGEISSLSDSTFAFINLFNGDVLRFQKSNLSYIDSSRLSLSSNFMANQFQELQDGFILRGDSGLSVFNKTDLSHRGTYLAQNPLNQGRLSVNGNQLFFIQNNSNYWDVSNYHVLEAAQLNQAPSTIVEGLILKLKNLNFISAAHPSGVANLYRVNSTWEITLLNQSTEIIDSMRVLWADPYAVPYCFSTYSELTTGSSPLAIGDSLVISLPLTYNSVYAPNGTGSISLSVAAVMANGKVLSDEARSAAGLSISNISLIENELLKDLQLYPNPASTFIYMDAPLPINQVKIMNLQGKVMRELRDVDGLSQVSLEGLAKGIYWVTLKAEKLETIRKIVID